MAASTAEASSPTSFIPPCAPTSSSTPPGFPVPAASFDANVDGSMTRFSVASFGDCFFVSATQTGALGTVMKVTRGDGRAGALGGGAGADLSLDDDGDRPSSTRPPLSSFDVATLSGRRDSPILEASARSLASFLLSKGVERPSTIVSLALKDDEDASTARKVVEKLEEAIGAEGRKRTNDESL